METKLFKLGGSRVSSGDIPACSSLASQYKRVLHIKLVFFTFIHVENKPFDELFNRAESIPVLDHDSYDAKFHEDRYHAETNNNDNRHEQSAEIDDIEWVERFTVAALFVEPPFLNGLY